METTESLSPSMDFNKYQRAAFVPIITALMIILVYFIWGFIGSVFSAIGFTMSLLLGAWVGINILEEGGNLADSLVLALISGLLVGLLEFLLIDLIHNPNFTFTSNFGGVISTIVIFGFGGFAIGRIYQVLFMEPAPVAAGE